jgi:hypothetical protein
MKLPILCWIFSLSLITQGVAQEVTLKKTSIGSGEVHHATKSRSTTVSAIIGQPSPVNHFENNHLHLVQGFKTPQLQIHKRAESEKISVYPNPTFGKISIGWKDDSDGESLKLELTEISGRVIDERTVKKVSNRISLKGVNYQWNGVKQQDTVSTQTGFIAQDIEKIFPELVLTDPQGYKSVNYIGLIPHLVEAIKELKTENENLKALNNLSDEKISNFETRLRQIENVLVQKTMSTPTAKSN